MAGDKPEKLPSGKWRIRVEIAPDPLTRKRRWHTATFTSHDEARKAARKILGQIAEGSYAASSKTPLSVYLLEHWLPYYRTNVRESTSVQAISRINKHLLPRLGDTPLDQLRAMDIEQMYASMLREGLKSSTVHAVHMTLNSALIKAVQWELLSKNPAKGCSPGKGAKRPISLWSEEEISCFFEHVRGSTLHVFVSIIACTGMRRCECLALQWRDIDLDAGTIFIRRTVTRKLEGWGIGDPKSESSRRTNAIPDSLVELLKTYHQSQESGRTAPENWVIVDHHGKRMPVRTIQEQWTRAREACDLPPIRLHDLRHAAATTMLDAGIPLKVVSEHLGHSSITITADVYQHVTSEMARRAGKALERSL